MFVHDITDLPVTILKLVVDVTTRWIETTVYFWMLSFWIYFRLYMYPFRIIGHMMEECYGDKVKVNMNYNVMNMMLAFLLVLLGLHIFWFYLMIKALIRRLKNSKEQ